MEYRTSFHDPIPLNFFGNALLHRNRILYLSWMISRKWLRRIQIGADGKAEESMTRYPKLVMISR